MKEIYIGLGIFLKYDPDGNISTDRYMIYAGSDLQLSDEDFKKLCVNSWRWDENLDCWSHFI